METYLRMHLGLMACFLFALPSLAYADDHSSVQSLYCACLEFGSQQSQTFTEKTWVLERDTVCKSYITKSNAGHEIQTLSVDQCSTPSKTQQADHAKIKVLGAKLPPDSISKQVKGGMGSSDADSNVGLGGLGRSGTPKDQGGMGMGGLGTGGMRSSQNGMGRGRTGHRGLTVHVLRPVILGQVNPIDIRKKMSKAVPRIKKCYKKALTRNSQLTGKVTFKFTIVQGGRVAKSDVSGSTIKNKTLEKCVSRLIKTLKLSKARVKAKTLVRIPILFTP